MELRALLYLNLFLLGLYAVGVAAVYITSPRLRSVGWLLPFFGLYAAGILVFEFCPPGNFCFLAADPCFLGAYVLLDVGIQELTSTSTRARVPLLGLILLAVQFAGSFWLFAQGRPPASRTVLFSFLAAAELIAITARLLSRATPGTRVATCSLAAVLAVTAVFYLVRARLAVAVWTNPLALPPPDLRLVGLLLTLVSTVAILFGFLWITTEKLRLELERMARTDSLTGVLNRRAFESEFAREIARASRSGAPLSMLLMDIDHFKVINDLHGHMAGDTVLCELARLLQNDLRRADLVARLGGEEFATLLPDTDGEQAQSTAERLRAAIELLRIPAGSSSVNITASFGVTAWRGERDSWERLLQRVDRAMYQAKEAGRNCVHSV